VSGSPHQHTAPFRLSAFERTRFFPSFVLDVVLNFEVSCEYFLFSISHGFFFCVFVSRFTTRGVSICIALSVASSLTLPSWPV